MVPGARWHQQLRASALITLGLGRELALEAGVHPQPGIRRRSRWQASCLGACIFPTDVRLIGGLRSIGLRDRLQGRDWREEDRQERKQAKDRSYENAVVDPQELGQDAPDHGSDWNGSPH